MSNSKEGQTIRDIKWHDRTDGKEGVTLLQFADRFSRILYLTALQWDETPVVLETLTAISLSIGETVESFGPFDKGVASEELGGLLDKGDADV